jgi:GT2 family glycosyltransferase
MTEIELSTVAVPEPVGAPGLPTATVVICAYTEKRWDQIVAAVESVRRQSVPATQCVLVIDHNPELLERAREAFPDVDVVANSEDRGLSGGRNTGVDNAKSDVVVFLDDDAEADPRWLERLLAPYANPSVIGTGGAALPRWSGNTSRPRWFPAEFDWVVGCSYRGLPDRQEVVRNPIGANMSFRSEAFRLAGRFDSGIGRLGTLPLGCEETVFSIRLHRATPGGTVVYVPDAVVLHNVSSDRTTVGYFLRRCLAEGLSKAVVAGHVGQTHALASERRYTTRVLPSGFVRGLVTWRAGEYSPEKSGMIAVGLLVTTVGYALGRLGFGALAAGLIGQRTR